MVKSSIMTRSYPVTSVSLSWSCNLQANMDVTRHCVLVPQPESAVVTVSLGRASLSIHQMLLDDPQMTWLEVVLFIAVMREAAVLRYANGFRVGLTGVKLQRCERARGVLSARK